MDWLVTLAFAAAAAALVALFGWLGARTPDLQRGPRMIPWRALMILAAVGFLLMVVHLANLAGVATGRGGNG